MASLKSNFQETALWVLELPGDEFLPARKWAELRGEDLGEATPFCFPAWSQGQAADGVMRDGWLISLSAVSQKPCKAPDTLWFHITQGSTPQCHMYCITFLFSRILRLSKPCHVYVDSQAPVMQSFPFSLANKHPIKMCSYHGFSLTNLGSINVKFGFVKKKKKKVFSD